MENKNNLHSGSSQRGYGTFLGLLLVLVIISILMYTGYFSPNNTTYEGTAISAQNRANVSVCTTNRSQLQAQITQTMASGEEESESVGVQIKFANSLRCPDEGLYEFDKDGNIYCTQHFPVPDYLLTSVYSLK
jgi:competence protein ComGC